MRANFYFSCRLKGQLKYTANFPDQRLQPCTMTNHSYEGHVMFIIFCKTFLAKACPQWFFITIENSYTDKFELSHGPLTTIMLATFGLRAVSWHHWSQGFSSYWFPSSVFYFLNLAAMLLTSLFVPTAIFMMTAFLTLLTACLPSPLSRLHCTRLHTYAHSIHTP